MANLQALGDVPRWQQMHVTKPAGTVTVDFQKAEGNGQYAGGLWAVCRVRAGDLQVVTEQQVMVRQEAGKQENDG